MFTYLLIVNLGTFYWFDFVLSDLDQRKKIDDIHF